MSDAAAHDDDLAPREGPADREAAILDELAELGLELARGLQQRALAAEVADEAAGLATAFQRVARCVRQCLALKARLGRDGRREARELKREADADLARRIRERKAMVFARLERAVDEQTQEDDDFAGSRLEDLRDRLDEEGLDEGFLDADLSDLMARLHRQLGLEPPATAEPLDQGSGKAAPAEQGSARPRPAPEPWQANGRLAPPPDLPSWETG